MKKNIFIIFISLFLAGCSNMFDTKTSDGYQITPQKIFSGANNAKSKELQNTKSFNELNNIDK